MNCSNCKISEGDLVQQNAALRDGLCHRCTAAACAEKDAALRLAVELGIEHIALCPEDDTCDCGHNRIDSALSNTAGQGWLAPQEAAAHQEQWQREAAAHQATIRELNQLQAKIVSLQEQRGACSVCGFVAWRERNDGSRIQDCLHCQLQAFSADSLERLRKAYEDVLLHSCLRVELTNQLKLKCLPSRDRQGNAAFLDAIDQLRQRVAELEVEANKIGLLELENHALRLRIEHLQQPPVVTTSALTTLPCVNKDNTNL